MTKDHRSSTVVRWTTALLVLGVALGIHTLNDFAALDIYWPPTAVDTAVEAHFSETYYQARALFRQRAKAANAKLVELPVPHLSHLDLSVDVAVFHGTQEELLVHVSGTHGVEGFAGSAIQSKILEQAPTWGSTGPSVVLIHALNAFGFAQLRRFNEHNVDLNRNWLSKGEFKERISMSPNAFGYEDVYDALNPSAHASWSESYWVRAVYHLLTKGFAKIKRAVVTGNHHFPASIFYGGIEKQPSLAIVEECLETHIDFSKVRRLAVIDVHTGLGKSGDDTLMLTKLNNRTAANEIFPAEMASGKAVPMNDASNPVVRGYDAVGGYVADGIASLGPSEARHSTIAMAQEFGTVPGIFVLKAVSEENAHFHQAPTRRLPFAEKLRDVFYVHRSVSWKTTVLARGVAVFERLRQAFSSSPGASSPAQSADAAP
ncbi:hypothetical protein PINS_up008663 [Pythium insidiosum]|nr:hypothetical protein PINS_up008663 [Pythium insidiosum]